MMKSIYEIIKARLKFDIGKLKYEYLNDIEGEIKNSLTASKLIDYYSIDKYKNGKRGICPFCNTSNPTTIEFNDNEKIFHCFACGESGTYLEFIAQEEFMNSKDKLNEAKIFAANTFANMNLGFSSVSDFTDKLTNLIMDRYKETGKLYYTAYLDIRLLPDKYYGTGSEKEHNPIENKTNDSVVIAALSSSRPKKEPFALKRYDINSIIKEEEKDQIEKTRFSEYGMAIQDAKNSRLIRDFTTMRSELNDSQELYDFMGKKYNIDEQKADTYGIIYFKKDYKHLLFYKDFFLLNDRLFYPYQDDKTGIIVGYQCRNVLLYNQKRPKYLNVCDYKDELEPNNGSKPYRGFKSLKIGRFLFNLYNIKNRKVSTLWITEGAADCIKLSSLGYDAVSPGQANISDYQIYLISKYFGNNIQVNVFFDNDPENNLTGQNNSFLNAYKLWQYGFNNIHIVRTYKDIGKDLTDCSVKLLNDNILMELLKMWERESYIFTPASEDDLNELLGSRFYSQSDAFKIDPRKIKDVIKFAEFIEGNIDTKDLKPDQIKAIKSLNKCSVDTLKLLKPKTPDEASPKEPVIENKDNDEIVGEDTNIESENANTASFEVQVEDGSYVDDITPSQLYVLRQKFDLNIIKEISLKCNKKQVNSIIGNIKHNKKFNISTYLH